MRHMPYHSLPSLVSLCTLDRFLTVSLRLFQYRRNGLFIPAAETLILQAWERALSDSTQCPIRREPRQIVSRDAVVHSGSLASFSVSNPRGRWRPRLQESARSDSRQLSFVSPCGLSKGRFLTCDFSRPISDNVLRDGNSVPCHQGLPHNF